MKMRKLGFALILLMLPLAVFASDDACSAAETTIVPVIINPDIILRRNVPKSLFGFNLPWYDFQLGHFRDGKVRDTTIDYLKPFQGAVYRFPGGNTYAWQRAIGNSVQRQKVVAAYTQTGYEKPLFGLEEYAKFLTQVDGNAIMMLNVVGPDGVEAPAQDILEQNVGLVNWFRSNSLFKCSSGAQCRVKYWELGNELDWPNTNWSADKVAERAKPVIKRLKELDPNIAILSLGKTAPWNTPDLSLVFNATLASMLGGDVVGVTLHPYYDGYDIPSMMQWIEKTLQPYIAINADAKVVITEHGRWPTQTSTNWADDWHKASGSIGAVSSADFILSIMSLPGVEAAAWHGLGVKGPWQLFHYDIAADEIYPSAVYWGLRVIRDAYLENTVQVLPGKVISNDYAGGYSLHLAAMNSVDGKLSLLGVNRGKSPIRLAINITSADAAWNGARETTLHFMTADANSSDNTDEEKNKFVMQTNTVDSELFTGKNTVCIPSQTIFSIIR